MVVERKKKVITRTARSSQSKMHGVPFSSGNSTIAVPVEHETLKSGRDGTTDGRRWTTLDDAGRTDVKVEIFM